MRFFRCAVLALLVGACGSDPVYPFFDIGTGPGASDATTGDTGDAGGTDPDTTPDDTTPDDTTPDDTTPGDATPGATTPDDTTPDDTTPDDTTPDDTTPGDTTPGDTTPGDTTPDAPVGGACLNADDDRTLAFAGEAAVETALACGQECAGDRECTAACVGEASALSSSCAGCFAALGTCLQDACSAACAGADLTRPECASCAATSCASDFDDCSGRGDLLPEPVAPDTCIRASPSTLAFGTHAADTFPTETVLIENCGSAGDGEVRVTRARVEPAVGAAFELFGTPTFPATLRPGESLALELGYRPAQASDTALLQVESTAGPVTVPLSGSRASASSPVIAGGCQLDPAAPPSATIDVTLPAAVACTANGTTGAASVRWEWVSRPADSQARILGPSRLRAPLVLDSPGRYEIRLTATSASGATASRTYMITALAPPTFGLVIALYWDTPSEADPFGTTTGFDGADMDLHLRNTALGCWASSPADCYYANLNPDWGAVGAANDPVLLVDDTGALGPEVIELADPEEFALYEAAVQYWDPRVPGAASTPLFAVYADGTLVRFLAVSPLTEQESWNIAFELGSGLFGGWEVSVINEVDLDNPPLCAE
jgi:hypothetical protein